MKENPFGLVNMLGNVSEFCLDWYDKNAYAAYPETGVTDPTGPAEGSEHVIRGRIIQEPVPRGPLRGTWTYPDGSLAEYRPSDTQKCLVVFRLYTCRFQGCMRI